MHLPLFQSSQIWEEFARGASWVWLPCRVAWLGARAAGLLSGLCFFLGGPLEGAPGEAA